MVMIRPGRPQRSIELPRDEALPIEVRELPQDVAAVDGLLSDPGLPAPFVEHWQRDAELSGVSAAGHGRRTVTRRIGEETVNGLAAHGVNPAIRPVNRCISKRLAALWCMIRATLTLKIRPGHELEFQRAWQDVAAEVRRLPGSLRQALTRNERDPSAFTITSDWADEDSFRAFECSPEQDELTATLRALRESACMRVDDLVAHLESEAA